MKWFETLPEKFKTALFETMRQIDEEADCARAEFDRLRPQHGEIAVGAGHFDHWITAEGRLSFLRFLREGNDPDEAARLAKEHCSQCVTIHNSKRPKDVNWQRWEGTQDSRIDTLVMRVHQAVMPKGLVRLMK